MKFSFPSSKQKNEQQQQQQEKTILFVCVENAGRSQMAEGFFNQRYAPRGYRSISAGTRPVSQITLLQYKQCRKLALTSAAKNPR